MRPEEAKARLAELDAELAALLERRAELLLSLPAGAAQGVLHRPPLPAAARLEGRYPAEVGKAIFRELSSGDRALLLPIQVSFLGPEASFTHQAALRHFGHGAQLLPAGGIPEVFRAVEGGSASFGVVPVENSLEGAVSLTLDALVDSELTICGEVSVEIAIHLLSREEDPARVRAVYSHPHAIAQCRPWLSRHLPGVPIREEASTSAAARRAAEEAGAAALASGMAADLYGLRTLAEKVDIQGHNLTRFFVIGREAPPRGERSGTSLLVAIPDRPGALHQMLAPFAEGGINLTKIESRPSRRKAWEYVFFIDLEGHREDPPVRAALDRLAAETLFLKVLGSYARSQR
ncbi:MAG: prephenate dehydratase [Nitrospinota bacterium]